MGVADLILPEDMPGFFAGWKRLFADATKRVSNGSGGSSSDENILTGEVAEVMFVGEALECPVVVGDTSMRLKLHPTTKAVPGQKIELAIAVDRCRVLAE